MSWEHDEQFSRGKSLAGVIGSERSGDLYPPIGLPFRGQSHDGFGQLRGRRCTRRRRSHTVVNPSLRMATLADPVRGKVWSLGWISLRVSLQTWTTSRVIVLQVKSPPRFQDDDCADALDRDETSGVPCCLKSTIGMWKDG
jgi:hypothetical protein